MGDARRLNLVHERKFYNLIPDSASKARWEASGVLVKGVYYFVVFDNRTEIAQIAADLTDDSANGLFGMVHVVRGYEGITYNAERERYNLLVEAREHSNGCDQAAIVEYDADFQYRKERQIELEFESENKGFEAATHLVHGGQDYLLALCEGTGANAARKDGRPVADLCICS